MAIAASLIKSFLGWPALDEAGEKNHSTEAAPARPRTVDTRFHRRFPVNYSFRFLWQEKGQHGQSLVVRGKNMSESGLLVKSIRPFERGTIVVVHCPELKLMTSASVRHCRRAIFNYHVGLEFRQPLMRTL